MYGVLGLMSGRIACMQKLAMIMFIIARIDMVISQSLYKPYLRHLKI
jgi:hypothetical protein